MGLQVSKPFFKSMKRVTVAVVGRGNVASHLIESLKNSPNIKYVGVITRDNGAKPKADIYIVSVSDDAIKEVTAELSLWIDRSTLVVHTSGSRGINELHKDIKRKGVIYPFQTFTKGVDIEMKEVPFFIEAENPNDIELIEFVAKEIGGDVTLSSSEARRLLHIAGVFACNFTNAMLSVSQELCEEANLDFSLLKPLVTETVRKAMSAKSVKAVQTGPAVRGDERILESHCELLKQVDSDYERIYKEISKLIRKK